MNSLQKLLQADKEALLKRNLKPAVEREAYDGLVEAIDLAGGLQEADAEVSARMHVMATTDAEPKEPVSAEIEGSPTDRDLSPEGVEKTLEAARTGTQPSQGPGGPAGRAKPAPEDDLGELDPSQACKDQDGTCESCQ